MSRTEEEAVATKGGRGRDLFLVTDTALVAATNAGVLVLASRALTPSGLSSFSLVLLVLTTGVALQRAAFLSPGFAAQRFTGRAGVPLRWAFYLSAPTALIAAGLIIFTLGEGNARDWLVPVLLAAAATIWSDLCRSHLIGAGIPLGAVLADGCTICVMAALFLLRESGTSVLTLVMAYAAATSFGLFVFMVVVFFKKTYKLHPRMKFRAIWQLGRWSGLDYLMSAVANLLPMLTTTIVLAQDYAGIYRVLQAALGPLNIISTTVLTSFGLDAWKIQSRKDLIALSLRVRKTSGMLFLVTAVYLAAAEFAVISLAELKGDDVYRIALIVAVSGLLTSLSIPIQAGALALGRHKSGAVIRVFVLSFALVATFGALGSDLLPWGDPIGVISIFAAVANLIGWGISFIRAQRLERRLVSE